MSYHTIGTLRIPHAPRSIQKGSSLADLLGPLAVECLAHNIQQAMNGAGCALGAEGNGTSGGFDTDAFCHTALDGLAPLGLMERGHKLAEALHAHLPGTFAQATDILLASLTPPLTGTEDFGLGVFFYLPHTSFVARYGLDAAHNGGGKNPSRSPCGRSMRSPGASARSFLSGLFWCATRPERWPGCWNGQPTPTRMCAACARKAAAPGCPGACA